MWVLLLAISLYVLIIRYASSICIFDTQLSAVHHKSVMWPCMLDCFIKQIREHQVLTALSSDLEAAATHSRHTYEYAPKKQ